MTHVRTVTRHTGCAGFASITLPAAPWEAGRPWEARQKRKPHAKGVASRNVEMAVCELLRDSGDMSCSEIARSLSASEPSVRSALRQMHRRGEVTGARANHRKATLWSLPE